VYSLDADMPQERCSLVPKVVFSEDRCKGCELCVAVCPQKIIFMADRMNSRGFRPATVIEMDKCTGCTLCARVCPDTVIEVYRDAPAAKEG